MKHINESIIGRKGSNTTKLWLLYPVGKDYLTALEMLPEDCKIYCNSTVLFCVNRQQLKEFFSRLSNKYNMYTYTNPESALFEIDSRYLRNFKDVKNLMDRFSSTEEIDLIYWTKELNHITADIPKYIKSL